MKTSQLTDVLFPLLFEVKQELGTVSKSSANPFFKSSYASLNTHLEVVEPVLSKHGLMLLQPPCENDTGTGSLVETVIIEPKSGQWISGSLLLVLAKASMQDMGSAVTYARRYTLGSLLGMQAVDDDGQIATHGDTKKPVTAGYNTTKEGPTTTAKSSFRKPKKTEAVTKAPSETTEAINDTGGWE